MSDGHECSLEVVGVDLESRTVVLRCPDCRHEMTMPGTVSVDPDGVVRIDVQPSGYLEHIATELEWHP